MARVPSLFKDFRRFEPVQVLCRVHRREHAHQIRDAVKIIGFATHTVAPSACAVAKSEGIPVRVVKITGIREYFGFPRTMTHKS